MKPDFASGRWLARQLANDIPPMNSRIYLCAKCLEEICHCEQYRKRWPQEYQIRDRLGYAPIDGHPYCIEE